MPEEDPKAWGKIIYPKGTTTLIGDTLEKKGLMTWPLGLAMRELFGFYDFTNENSEKMSGFSKDVGTMWADGKTLAVDQETLFPLVKSAADAWKRKQKKGADIGSVVHDAIEHYIKNELFDIEDNYLWAIKESEFETEALFDKAILEAPNEVAQAKIAFDQFVVWWTELNPTLHGAEDLLYSLEYNVCGTYDADLSISGKHHPVYKDKELVRCTADWKTSNASKSEAACMPEGIGYQYFIQSAIYEMIRREMGETAADDLLIVSCRKDGGFTTIFASELGLEVEDCINWAKAVIFCYRMREKTNKGLVAHATPQMSAEEAF